MRIYLVVAVVVLVGACKSKHDWKKEMDALDSFHTRCSTCSSKACIEEFDEAFAKWNATFAKDVGDEKPSHDVEVLLNDVRQCRAKAETRLPLASLARYKDTMCACKDANCTTGVRIGAEQARRDAQADNEDPKRVDDLWNQIVACMDKLVPPPSP